MTLKEDLYFIVRENPKSQTNCMLTLTPHYQ